jgi:UDP-glucose-4-epimerase GalE
MVTGGAGYIGSHAALRLLSEGAEVLVVDNLSRGRPEALAQLALLRPSQAFRTEHCDVTDARALSAVLERHPVDAVLHFAGKAYVGESVDDPAAYAWNNLAGTAALLQAMAAAGVWRMVFSSTCATYGEPPLALIPISEECPQRPVNPYGRSKLAAEELLEDERIAAGRAGRPFAYAILRYFNVAGCDRQGRLGEDHRPETHLVPIALEVALRQRPALSIHGVDYPTQDGTCVRDYVHVDDLIDAHLLALESLTPGTGRKWNVGLGHGASVMEVIQSVRRVTGREVPTVVGPRREGDPPILFADAARIRRELGWSPRVTELDEIVSSAWRWRERHPRGYA